MFVGNLIHFSSSIKSHLLLGLRFYQYYLLRAELNIFLILIYVKLFFGNFIFTPPGVNALMTIPLNASLVST